MININKKETFQYFAALTSGIVCAVYSYSFYEGFIHRADFLYWDPASHALFGVRLTAAIESFDLLNILKLTNEQALWPPLHSYLQFPFMVFYGKNFFASSLCSLSFLILLFVAATYCYRQISQNWAGLLFLLALIGSCSYYQGYATMPMHEIFGLTLTIFCAGLYLKHSRYLPISLLLLFFLKYNYFIYIALPIAVVEIAPRILSFRTKKKEELLGLITPFRIFVTVYLALLGVILLTGGFKIGKISVRGIGNPLYILFVLVLVRGLLNGEYRRVWEKVRGTGWDYFIVFVILWLLIPIPNRIKTMVSFFINEPLSGHSPTDLSYYTFYFEKLPGFFSSIFVLATVASLAMLYAIVNWRKKETKFLVFAFIVPFLLMTLNQNKQDRFLFTFVIFLQLLAACMVGTTKITSARYLFLTLLLVLIFYSYDKNKTKDLVAWPFVPSHVDEKVRFISEEVIDAQEITILGVSNEISPSLLSYHILKHNNFSSDIEFHWKIETPSGPKSHLVIIQPPANTQSIRIERLKLINNKVFSDSTKIQHYVLSE